MTRIAVIKKDKCNSNSCNFLCVKLCPINRTGKDCITEQENKPRIDEELCTGCGICSNRCPFGAISIINLPEELAKQPIHQYGENGFRLYSLPTPIFGKVVGIIGKNGIGKSTAIKILAGILKPNLGKEKASYEELIKFFKGSEAQKFFELLKAKKIKVSYKPQQIELIPKTFKGKVKDLLKRVDEKNKLNEIAKLLGIEEILEHDIKTISGGELQRVTIGATVLKKANLYIFDEPTSYLDVKQRVNISKFIRNLIDDKTAIIVVEHDLIILDYMTDLIHIMYGKSGCYGIVSQLKSTRAGINIYLSGYLREENIRFRDKEIKFEARAKIDKKGVLLTKWNNIVKSLDSFVLKAEEGEIYKNEVIGVLGENGIGKTTFVKILANVLKADKGSISKKVRVSYKPQYLNSESEEIVMNILKEAIKNYNHQLIKPLKIEELFFKKINQLSGGELQKVAIALCLSRDAELYLLDEPSAYLDIEERLLVSKIIKDFIETKDKSALIVDHDLLFIDYLSQNLIVFDGKPALEGYVKGPFSMECGMNIFLKKLDITMRRDKESNRPRINKPGSVKDREQKIKNKFYYS